MQWHDEQIFKEVTNRNGSISAEHGVGLHKPQYLHLQKSPQALALLKSIKNLFDPQGIMNPYKVIPEWGMGWRVIIYCFDWFFKKDDDLFVAYRK